MALLRKPPEDPSKIPPAVEARLRRAKDQRDDDKGKRSECLAFWRGQQFKYLDPQGSLRSQPTSTNVYDKTGKPPHRFRLVRNLIYDIVEREVSATTQRVPSYEINPSTTDAEDVSAARLAEKVALFGYDKWRVRQATEKVVRYAVIADEGFAWPYFDNSIGPYITSDDKNAAPIGQGEVRVRVFGANEVGWEKGLSFEDSPYHVIEQARDIEAVYQMEGYNGGKLKADAEGGKQLVLVTEYLERPCPKYASGRWLTIANGKVIAGIDGKEVRSYPCTDPDGEVIDEPVLHRLTYSQDPEMDRGVGLVRHLVDPQRVVNDMPNRQLEWVRLATNPQVIIQNGELKQRLTDEPGAVYQAVGTGEIVWRPVPPIPRELEEIKQSTIADMGRIAAQNDIPSNIEAGRAIQTLTERDAQRRQGFIANLSDFHSRLMRHCLYLVQKHYTEDRVLKIRGRDGTDPVQDFTGAQLRGQADVYVTPASIEPRTREVMEQKVMNLAQLGWISPDAAMQAINNGSTEGLIKSSERDISRAQRVIRSIQEGTFQDAPQRAPFPNEDLGLDPETNQPVTSVPEWMPRPIDSVPVHKAVFEDWMKQPDYDNLPDDQRQAATAYYGALITLEEREAQKAAMLQMQQAEQMGMNNAQRPPQQKPNPSLPALSQNGSQTS